MSKLTDQDRARVGRAFRNPKDNIVRWITHLNSKNRYVFLWFDEEKNIWHHGGTCDPALWTDGPEVPHPQPGDTYKYNTTYGAVGTRTVPK